MTNETLEKANKLKEEIKELEEFIRAAEGRWTGTIIKQTQRYIFRANACGFKDDCNYILDTETKDKLLKVLYDHLQELKEELDEL